MKRFVSCSNIGIDVLLSCMDRSRPHLIQNNPSIPKRQLYNYLHEYDQSLLAIYKTGKPSYFLKSDISKCGSNYFSCPSPYYSIICKSKIDVHIHFSRLHYEPGNLIQCLEDFYIRHFQNFVLKKEADDHTSSLYRFKIKPIYNKLPIGAIQ